MAPLKVILSHPTSNQFNRAAAKGLLDANLLYEFHTAIASFPGSALDQLAAISPFFSDVKRRHFDPALFGYVRTWPWLEAGRLLASKVGAKKFIRHESGLFSLDAVYRHQDKRVSSLIPDAATRHVKAVYAYEDGAAFSFRACKKHGIRCFYDLPIGYWRAGRRLLQAEAERWPEWASTLTGLQDSLAKLARKDEELSLADRVFVASTFTAGTLKEFPGEIPPVEVIPYGFPTPAERRSYVPLSGGRKLKLLFVGGLSQRKGIADVFAVADKLKDYVSLTIVGHNTQGKCPALDAALARHRWIPTLSHVEVLKIMREHDVLIFPSLFEGFGLVITEAMSQGTPVITTDRTAGPDLIDHKINGWLIKAGVTAALLEAVEDLLIDPQSIIKAGKSALETAHGRPWEKYGSELAEAILNHERVKTTKVK